MDITDKDVLRTYVFKHIESVKHTLEKYIKSIDIAFRK